MYSRALVTGGAGFIGSHLCDTLIKNGFQVYCLDDLSTGSLKNISHLLYDNNFTFIKQDVIDPLDLDVDWIFNLACPASPVHYQSDPVKTLKTSIFGAINVLDLAMKKNARVMQFSTSEIYGDPLINPQIETYWGNVNPIGIRSCYDEGKRISETLFYDYYRKYSVDIKVIRIFNTYGPKMSKEDGRVIPNFINQALNNEDISIYGDGSQTRSLCYIDDLIEGILKMMKIPNFIGPVNLGNPNEMTIKELADTILKLTKSTSSIIYRNLPSDDPKKRNPNISLASEKLNWSPKILLEDGLLKTIQFYKDELNDGK